MPQPCRTIKNNNVFGKIMEKVNIRNLLFNKTCFSQTRNKLNIFLILTLTFCIASQLDMMNIFEIYFETPSYMKMSKRQTSTFPIHCSYIRDMYKLQVSTVTLTFECVTLLLHVIYLCQFISKTIQACQTQTHILSTHINRQPDEFLKQNVILELLENLKLVSQQYIEPGQTAQMFRLTWLYTSGNAADYQKAKLNY